MAQILGLLKLLINIGKYAILFKRFCFYFLVFFIAKFLFLKIIGKYLNWNFIKINSFIIEDTSEFTNYLGGGYVE